MTGFYAKANGGGNHDDAAATESDSENHQSTQTERPVGEASDHPRGSPESAWSSKGSSSVSTARRCVIPDACR
jgi:hypothetical protein